MTASLVRKNPLPLKSFPIRVERCGRDGWFFIACDEIPGLSAFGPELQLLFTQLENAGEALLRLRGIEHIELAVEVVPNTSPMISDGCTWAEANKYELRELMAA